jgi:hypothetical protein
MLLFLFNCVSLKLVLFASVLRSGGLSSVGLSSVYEAPVLKYVVLLPYYRKVLDSENIKDILYYTAYFVRIGFIQA